MSSRYKCGSAREFKTSDGHLQDFSMTCLWDKSWEPDYRLPGPCDWVACLKPPLPPVSTNLRVTDWDEKPIPFGDSIRYVCKRGHSFEEDPAQLEQTYTCQDGTAPDTNRGFFDVPIEEDEWPRCVRGKMKKLYFHQFPQLRFAHNLLRCLRKEYGISSQIYSRKR